MEIFDSKENLDKLLKTNDMILLYFGTDFCNVCHAIKPKLREILENYPKIKCIYIEVDKLPIISTSYNIFTIPAIILFINGRETIRKARFINLQEMEKNISRLYELYYS